MKLTDLDFNLGGQTFSLFVDFAKQYFLIIIDSLEPTKIGDKALKLVTITFCQLFSIHKVIFLIVY